MSLGVICIRVPDEQEIDFGGGGSGRKICYIPKFSTQLSSGIHSYTLQILTQVHEIAILHIDRSGNIAKEWA